MTPNEGTLDRGLRMLAGLALIFAATAGWIGRWGWVGLVPLMTGMVGWCPLYWPLGFSTCRSKR